MVPLTRAEQAEQTRARILDVATELFGTHGYDDTSLQLIADTIGLTKAAVYYHYRTKIEILRAIVEPARRDVDTLLDEAVSLPRGPLRVAALRTSFVDFLVTRRSLLTMVTGDPLIKARIDQEIASDDGFDDRAIRLLFGTRPSARQRATYYAIGSLAEVTARMPELSDAALRRVLAELFDAILTYGQGTAG